MSLFKSPDAFIHKREKEGKLRRINNTRFRISFWNMYLCVLDSTSQVFNRWAMTLRIVYLPCFLFLRCLSVCTRSLCYSWKHTWALCTWSGWPPEHGILPVPVQTRNHTCTRTHRTSKPLLDKPQPVSIAEFNSTENIPEPQVQRL